MLFHASSPFVDILEKKSERQKASFSGSVPKPSSAPLNIVLKKIFTKSTPNQPINQPTSPATTMRLSSSLLLCAAPLLVAAESLRAPAARNNVTNTVTKEDPWAACDSPQCAGSNYCPCTIDGRCPEDSRCEMVATFINVADKPCNYPCCVKSHGDCGYDGRVCCDGLECHHPGNQDTPFCAPTGKYKCLPKGSFCQDGGDCCQGLECKSERGPFGEFCQ